MEKEHSCTSSHGYLLVWHSELNILAPAGICKIERLIRLTQFVSCMRRGELHWKLGSVNFRNDFWDCYQGQGKTLANS